MSYGDMTLAQAVGEAPPAPLSFTSAELFDAYGPDGPDADDLAGLDLAMDRDMGDRLQVAERRVAQLEDELRELGR